MKKALLLTTAAAIAIFAPEDVAQKTRCSEKEKLSMLKEAVSTKALEAEAAAKAVQPIIEKAKKDLEKTLAKKNAPENPEKIFFTESFDEYDDNGNLTEVTITRDYWGKKVFEERIEHNDEYCNDTPDCTKTKTEDYTYHDNNNIATINHTERLGESITTFYEEFAYEGHKTYDRLNDEHNEIETENYFSLINGKSMPTTQYLTQDYEDSDQYSHTLIYEYDEVTGVLLQTKKEDGYESDKTTPSTDVTRETYQYNLFGELRTRYKNYATIPVAIDYKPINNLNKYVRFYIDGESGIIKRVRETEVIIEGKKSPKENIKLQKYVGKPYQSLSNDFQKVNEYEQ